ncbi:hypothetical protein [Actinoplanes sp. NPDC026619]|uniref:hypothetical protein n=1 Tax=Actinoplanes sp. NPDC026619 TaxID=3155798 RepID=UPI0033FA247A
MVELRPGRRAPRARGRRRRLVDEDVQRPPGQGRFDPGEQRVAVAVATQLRPASMVRATGPLDLAERRRRAGGSNDGSRRSA